MYQIWNKAIFDYFFNSSEKGQEVLFNVDKDIIESIGNKYKIDKPFIDFCKNVSNYILKKDKNNKYKISLEHISLNVEQNIPQQTALIAFFILAASMMKADKEHSSRNYYKRLMELSLNSSDKNIVIIAGVNDKQSFKDIFEKFQTYINDTLNGNKGYIYFKGINEKDGRKNKDYIGIPIFQSMISQKDKCILTKIFDEKRDDDINLSDLPQKGFSTVFNKMISEEKYQGKMLVVITKLRENWNGIIEEIYNGQKRNKINVKLLYCEDDEYVSFYEFFYLRKNIEKIHLSDKYFENKDSIFINLARLHNLNHFNGQELKNEENITFKFPENQILLFKFDDNGYYLQTNSINIGDKFSLLAYPSIFKSYSKELSFITGMTKEELESKLIRIHGNTPEKYLLHGVFAKKYFDCFIKIKENLKIICTKGLKVNNEQNTYLLGVGPLICVNQNTDKIALNDKIISANFVNQYIDKPGIYNLSVQDKSKTIIITEHPFENEYETYIYHTYYNKHLNDISINFENVRYVNGLHLHNFEEESEINEKAILRIINIIKSINRKKDGKKIFYDLELKSLKFITDKTIVRSLKSLKQNKIYNPAQIIYLNKLKNLLGGNFG